MISACQACQARLLKSPKRLFAIAAVFLLLSAAAVSACCDSIIVDADMALEKVLGEGREPVEGLWSMNLDYNPEPDTSDSYRIIIIKNEYSGIYPTTGYLGIVAADVPGAQKGEIKLLLNSDGGRGKFYVVVITEKGFGRGPAALLSIHAEADSLDMKGVVYGSNIMTKQLRRIDG